MPVWPNRPQDIAAERGVAARTGHEARRIAAKRRYEAWRPAAQAPEPENRFEPEPLPCRLSSWTLTGVTAVLCPPAGASLAVLNIAKRANLRLNLHALTLTLVILSLHLLGALAGILRSVGL